MLNEYQGEKWFDLYRHAVIELERLKLTGRIADARVGITSRLEVLKGIPGLHRNEQNAISDALSMLRVLQHDADRFVAEEKKRLAEEALAKLEPLRAKIQQLDTSRFAS